MVIPTILEPELENIEKLIKTLEKVAPLIQIDVVDGEIIHGKSFTQISTIDEITTNAHLELDLMIKNPLSVVANKFIRVKSLVVYIKSHGVAESIKASRWAGYKVGIGIPPGTDLETISRYANDVDFVQFFTVEPGAQGRPFNAGVLQNITEFKKYFPKIPIQVDGGINHTTIHKVLHTEVDNVVIGSAIVKSQDPLKSYLEFKKIMSNTDKQNLNQNNNQNNGDKVTQISLQTENDSVSRGLKIKKVCFLGGASWNENEKPYQDSYETAKLLAQNGYEIVNGGGPGVMRASTLGAQAGGGKALAITYHPNKPKMNFEGIDTLNTFDEEVITLDYFDRTKVILQNSDVHIVFCGSTGTISEFGMTWASSRIHQGNHKPIILFGDFWNEILDSVEKNMKLRPGERGLLKICNTPQEVLNYIKELEKPE